MAYDAALLLTLQTFGAADLDFVGVACSAAYELPSSEKTAR